jgi:primosomal protein N' (replication factor Y)
VGTAPAFYQVLRGRTRERLLVQAEKNVDVQAYVRPSRPGASC